VFVVDRKLVHPYEHAPDQAGFEALALEVFGPLLEHLTTSKDET
jgi:hypothetical protein